MYLLLQLITYVADSQKLLRDLLIVLQIFGYCQRHVFLFLILLTGSVVQYNLSENHIVVLKELDPETWLLTC